MKTLDNHSQIVREAKGSKLGSPNFLSQLLYFAGECRRQDGMYRQYIYLLAFVNQKDNRAGINEIYRFFRSVYNDAMRRECVYHLNNMLKAELIERLPDKKYSITVKGRAYMNDILRRWERSANCINL